VPVIAGKAYRRDNGILSVAKVVILEIKVDKQAQASLFGSFLINLLTILPDVLY